MPLDPSSFDEDGPLDRAWVSIATGFRTRAEVIDELGDLAADDPDASITPADVPGIVDELWALRERQIAAGPPVSDAHRLEGAFAELRASGIVAAADTGWDQGEAEEICRAEAVRVRARGFVFFHHQDTARLLLRKPLLYLGFDAAVRSPDRATYDAEALAVAHQVCSTLVRHGLRVVWDGTVGSRIRLPGIDWRRPLPR
ncbi:hypothetical protein GIS00_09735 [Nakamurella sp. YIM 132087]|uniref:DUF6891 domain-containing protein n=1 Tax=Nakamurella alba TaxID=2665158 RepID=A0A7K1FJH4_9ACTN|nr:hypothetical protein [Nakamurella alba]MTD14226.1 hypothetical protein [Nakamurella alba]